MKAVRAIACAALGALASLLATEPTAAVERQDVTINGLKVWRFVWTDSKGFKRYLSLKKQGEGNPGNGGYAVQYAYKYMANGVLRTAVLNAPNGDGFGYFVSHERFRNFSDGSSASIADRIFGQDDSPLGRGFPVTARGLATGPNKKIIQFKLTYPRYGTVAAATFNANTGQDDPPLGTNPALYKLYQLPVAISWYFQDGRDHPRIVTRVDMSDVPGPDRVSFDVRGPYGKLDFDEGANPIQQVYWGDRFQFKTTSGPLTRNSPWTYTVGNTAYSRYGALVAGGDEMGLLEPFRFAQSSTNDGYSESRNKTSATYNNGNGCPFQPQLIPCDYEWPYQSSQYELPYNNPNGTTTSEKMAWGSTPYYGMSVNSTYDGTTGVPFNGFPASKAIQYHVCLVVGRFVSGSLTRTTAIKGGTYNCADTSLN